MNVKCLDHMGTEITIGNHVVYARLSGRSATLRTGVVEEVLLKDVVWRGGWVEDPSSSTGKTFVHRHHEEGVWRIKVQPDAPLYRYSSDTDVRPVHLKFPDRMVVI